MKNVVKISMEMKWFKMVLWMTIKNMQFLHKIHCIISHIFQVLAVFLFIFICTSKVILTLLILILALKQLFPIYIMGNMKHINIKNCTYYFFNYIINIKGFNSNILKIDKKSYENISIYYIWYITIKKIDDYENIQGENM